MKPSLKIKRPTVYSQGPEYQRDVQPTPATSSSESLLTPPKRRSPPAPMQSSSRLNVMGRLEWFRDLKTVFSLIQETDPGSHLVQKTELLTAMTQYPFDLQEQESYFRKETAVAFSYEEVYIALSALQDNKVAWDQVIDAIIQISVTRARGSTKRVEDGKQSLGVSQSVKMLPVQSVSVTKRSDGSRPPSQEMAKPQVTHSMLSTAYVDMPDSSSENTVDISFPDHKLVNYPNSKIEQVTAHGPLLVTFTQYLNLSGNLLEDLTVSLSVSLIILNLSFNQLTDFEMVSPLPNLRLLNLSNNLIKRMAMLQRCKGVTEAYLSHNKLSVVGAFCHLDKLSLLDLSQNNIAAFEDLATLAISSKLIALRLKGNPIASRSGYENTIRALLPKVQHFDPPSLRLFSDFEKFGSVAFITAKQSPVTVPVMQSEPISISETSSRRSDSQKRGSLARVSHPSNFHRYVHTVTPPRSHTTHFAESTNSTPLSRRTPGNSIADLLEAQLTNRSEEPGRKRVFVTPAKKTSARTHKVTIRRSARPDLNDSERVFRKEEKTKHSKGNQSFEQALSFLTEAERRLDDEQVQPEEQEEPPQEVREVKMRRDSKDQSVSIITSESIQNAHDRRYGDPVATLMIGPPAIGQRNVQKHGTPLKKESLGSAGKGSSRVQAPKQKSSSAGIRKPNTPRDGVVRVELVKRFK